jgi:hypothetical protein
MATPTTKSNRTVTSGKDQLILAGISKDLSTTKSIPLGGTTYTPTTLSTFIQSRIDAANEVVTAKAAWQNAAKAYLAINTQANVVVHDLKQFVIGLFGAEASQLSDFGFTPRKKTVLTPDQKVAAAAKRAATRKARGTVGPKAKLAIKGTVPTTAPATPAAPAAPAVTTTSSAPAPAPTGNTGNPTANPNQVTLVITTAPAPAPTQATAPAPVPAAAPATVQSNPAPMVAQAAAPVSAPTVPVNGTTVAVQAQPMAVASTPTQASIPEVAQAAPGVAQAAAKS